MGNQQSHTNTIFLETPKPVQRSRTASMYVERVSIEDFNIEMKYKLDSPNRGLKRAAERKLREPAPQPKPVWLQIVEESRAKKRNKDQQNWVPINQLFEN